MTNVFVGGCALMVAVGTAFAAPVTLSAAMTVDNQFIASISTSPTTAGTTFLTGNNWPTTYTGGFTFTEAGTYYLHVRATDVGRPEMFIGRFTLDSTDGTFSNGSQLLVTNTTDWTVSRTNYGISPETPRFIGNNGIGPWGTFPQMTGAAFIWSETYASTVYFTTEIVVVPAPATLGLAGFGGLMALRRRRR
ncbi:MAG: hypothetical protein KF859_09780 [Phycisphaeraceae bacterium]|nr:hypothetical protein [Phycisphaeraceae bacterium]